MPTKITKPVTYKNGRSETHAFIWASIAGFAAALLALWITLHTPNVKMREQLVMIGREIRTNASTSSTDQDKPVIAPQTIDEIAASKLDKQVDIWGNSLRFKPGNAVVGNPVSGTFSVLSNGPDELPDTSDDFVMKMNLANGETTVTPKQPIITEILRNCGPYFAVPICFFSAAGFVFLCVTLIIMRIWPPTRHRVYGLTESITQKWPEWTSKIRADKGKSESVAGKPPATDIPDIHARVAQKISDDTKANKAQNQANTNNNSGTSIPPVNNNTEPATETNTQNPTDVNNTSQNETPISKKQVSEKFDEDIKQLTKKAHPWLVDRLLSLLPTLELHGPDAARTLNQQLSEREESNVATRFLPALVCMWILPLLGFLGTVWGLHLAIGPLKDGVELMMEAVGKPENTSELRDIAMQKLGNGFDGLKVSFDSTLAGLTGTVLVGLPLWFMRRQAAIALTAIDEFADVLIQYCPAGKESLGEAMELIAKTIKSGLLHNDSRGNPSPYLAEVSNAVEIGLLVSDEKSKKKHLPRMAQATEILTKVYREEGEESRRIIDRDAGVLAQIGLNILRENRMQTIVQFRAIAPDLQRARHTLELLHTLGGGEGNGGTIPKQYIIPPDIDIVAQYPESSKLIALTVANGANRVCVSLHHQSDINSIEETRIDWKDGGYMLSGGFTF